MKSAVFIESNTTGTGRLFARSASDLGFKPILIAQDPGRYPYVAEDSVLCVREDTADAEAVAHILAQIERDFGVAGIYSTSDYFVALAASLAAGRGLAAPDPEAIQNCRHKGLQAQTLERAAVPIPVTRHATKVTELADAVGALTPPLVVKPARGSGSVGVLLCLTRDEAWSHGTMLLAKDENERGLRTPPEIVVQEYVEGREYSVETFGSQVIGVTRKRLSDPPYFVETGHDFPACLEAADEAAISLATRRALAALRVDWGPAHTELRLTDHGPVIIEVNPRLAGGLIPELVRLASGVDLIRETTRLFLGQRPSIVAHANRFASIRFLAPKIRGTLSGTLSLESAGLAPGVVDVKLYRKRGETVGGNRDFRDRIGHVIAAADSADDASSAAELASDRIHFEVVGDKS